MGSCARLQDVEHSRQRLGLDQAAHAKQRAADDELELAGEPGELPELDVLQAALAQHKPPRPPPQQVSTVERWSAAVSAMQKRGAKPKAIFDRLRLEHPDFNGSLSAIKRMCVDDGQDP